MLKKAGLLVDIFISQIKKPKIKKSQKINSLDPYLEKQIPNARRLGKGAFGEVKLVQDKNDKFYALKILKMDDCYSFGKSFKELTYNLSFGDDLPLLNL